LSEEKRETYPDNSRFLYMGCRVGMKVVTPFGVRKIRA